MAILRAEIGVTEERLLAEGRISDRVHTRYTLIHLAGVQHIASSKQDFGYSSTLFSDESDKATLTIKPTEKFPAQMPATELIVRTVLGDEQETKLERFILPNDPEFTGVELDLGEDTVQEVTYGRVPEVATSTISWDKLAGGFVPNNDQLFYLVNVLWVPDESTRIARARSFDDQWSE